MKSGLISLLVFTVLGPPIGLLIILHGDLEALVHPVFIIPCYIFGGPIAALTGVIFITNLAIALKTFDITDIRLGSGALIGGISGIIAAALFQLVDGNIFKTIEIYISCGFTGAICGAIRCFYPIALENRTVGSSN